ncbi:hypothetical protein [Curtobacterium citreum]|uniref:Uncharacterized protein n=1 Tax=Curtobacterium citreum TaxID=2036 RepID=A0ABT2HDI8_9MICO|nr:hypothetical protein [Curtobacterium citreum]MCS6521314.1 hypothetical protein [Curtobacterium citreum]TQJ28171.1 hypothetical protein FB462_2051 [Curtobacterium citreum]
MPDKYGAVQDLENAMVNANNVISFSQKAKPVALGPERDLATAIESIGFALHAIARAQKKMLE